MDSEAQQEAVEESNELPELSGAVNAAILLMAMGEENAANVLKHMEPEEVQAVGEAMTGIGPISQQEISSALDSFLKKIEGNSTIGDSPNSYLHRMLEKALGVDQSIAVMAQIDKNSIAPTLDALKWMPDNVVAMLIKHEHPQFIAIVLSYLNREKAAAVLETLPDEQKVDIVMRLTRLKTVHPIALKEVDAILEKKVSESLSIELAGAGGVKTAAEILNSVSTEVEENIFEKLSTIDSDLTESIRENMFVFENLLSIDDRGIQTLLRDITGDILIVALKGATQEVKNKIFSNMSSRAAVLLQDDLDAKGPIRLAEVEEAQKEILTVAMTLAEEGKISLGGKADDFV